MTVDVDVTVLWGFGKDVAAVHSLLRLFRPRIDDVLSFAARNRVALLKSDSGIGVDVSLRALPFEERVVARSSDWRIPEYGDVRTGSAEDLIVLKAFASRPRDWIDSDRDSKVRSSAVENRSFVMTCRHG